MTRDHRSNNDRQRPLARRQRLTAPRGPRRRALPHAACARTGAGRRLRKHSARRPEVGGRFRSRCRRAAESRRHAAAACAYRAAPTGASSAARSARAAASGSSASVIARTTTTRRAPRATTSPTFPACRPPIANHGRSRTCRAAQLHIVQARGRPPRLGRRRVHRPDGQVVDVRVPPRRVGLRRARAWSARRSAPARPRPAPRRASRRPGRRARRRRRRPPPDRGGRSTRTARRTRPPPTGTPAPPRSAPRRRASCRAAARCRPRRAAPRAGTPRAWRRRPDTGGRIADARGGPSGSSLAGGDTMQALREPAERAERAAPGRRPSNLIRVVPA